MDNATAHAADERRGDYQKFTSSKLIIILSLINCFVWMLLPSTLESGLRLDVAEAAAFGPDFQLTYAKHPPLSFWLTALAAKLGPFRYIAVHALGAIFSTFAQYYVARFCQRTMSEKAATVAILLGITSPFATYLAIQFNHNIALMPFWAMTIGCALKAFEKNEAKQWALLGLVVGLALWAKYAIALLCLPLLCALLIVPEWRQSLKTIKPYVAIIVCLLIVMPHLTAVYQQGGRTIQYALRVWHNDFSERLANAFLIIYIAALSNLLMFVIVAVAGGYRNVAASLKSVTSSAFKLEPTAIFYTLAAFGPVLIIFYSAFLGIRVRSLWVTPITLGFVFWWAHVAFNTEHTISIRRAIIAAGTVYALHIAAYLSLRSIYPYKSEVRYPEIDAIKLAEEAQSYWHERKGQELRNIIIVGDQRSLQAAGSIAFNSRHRLLVRPQQAIPFMRPVVINRIKTEGALIVSVKRGGVNTQIPDALGPFIVSNIESQPMPRTRGRADRTEIVFAIAQ